MTDDDTTSAPTEFAVSPWSRTGTAALRSPNLTKRRTIILIHGIRDQAAWMRELRSVLKATDPASLDVVCYIFPWYDLISFLLPIARKRIVRHFQSELECFFEQLSEDHRVDVIAHSFGTYVVANALKNLDSASPVQVDTLILCGSVLESHFNWSPLLSNGRLRRVINDCGIFDKPLIASQLLVWGTGMAGKIGFASTFSHGAITNRFFRFGHGGFFKRYFYETYWVPALMSESPVEAVDHRSIALHFKDRLVLTALNCAQPVKISAYCLTPLLLILAAVFGYLYGVEKNKYAMEQYRLAKTKSAIASENQGVALLMDSSYVKGDAKERQLLNAQSLFAEASRLYIELDDVDAAAANVARCNLLSSPEMTYSIAGLCIGATLDGERDRCILSFLDGSVQIFSYATNVIAELPVNLDARQFENRSWPRGFVISPIDGTIIIWDHEPGDVRCVASATKSPEPLLYIVEMKGDAIVTRTIPVETGCFRNCFLSPNGSIAFLVTIDGTIQVVDIKNGTATTEMKNASSMRMDANVITFESIRILPSEWGRFTFEVESWQSFDFTTGHPIERGYNEGAAHTFRRATERDDPEVIGDPVYLHFTETMSATPEVSRAMTAFWQSLSSHDPGFDRGNVKPIAYAEKWVALKHGDNYFTVTLPEMEITRWGGMFRNNFWQSRESITPTFQVAHGAAASCDWVVAPVSDDFRLDYALAGWRLWHQTGRIIADCRERNPVWLLDIDAEHRKVLIVTYSSESNVSTMKIVSY